MLVWGQSMVSELPSITSLRAFEAAARHLSFTRAATELDMTQGAVSQHIKKIWKSLSASSCLHANVKPFS